MDGYQPLYFQISQIQTMYIHGIVHRPTQELRQTVCFFFSKKNCKIKVSTSWLGTKLQLELFVETD